MKFEKNAWEQLKAKSCQELIAALEKDGAALVKTRGAVQVYRYLDGRRITIHYHPKKSYGPNLLKALIQDTGWTEDDMRLLGLIK